MTAGVISGSGGSEMVVFTGVSLGDGANAQMVEDGLENEVAVGAAEPRLARPLGVGHEAEDVAARVADARDVLERSVRVARVRDHALGVAVTEQDLAVGGQLGQGRFVGGVIAFAVGDGDVQHLARLGGAEERVIGRADPQEAVLADEMERTVADERAGQEPRLGQHLEAVADADQEPAVIGIIAHGFHNGRKPGDGTAAEVIAVGEAARQDHEIVALEGRIFMPHVIGRNPEDVLQGVVTILVAIGPRETDDGGFHELRIRERQYHGAGGRHRAGLGISPRFPTRSLR